MARLASSDRKKQILNIATELFAGHGYDGVTTRQIAEAAGITEAVVFRHFESKEELYWEVLSVKSAAQDWKKRLEEILSSDLEPLEMLTTIARERLEQNAEDPSKIRLLMFSALENHRLSERFYKLHIAELYDMVAAFVRRQMDEGRLRRMDPLIAARAFVGMVFHHSLVQELLGGNKYQSFDIGEVSRTVAEIWLGGMLSDEGRLSTSPTQPLRVSARHQPGTQSEPRASKR
jgi:AcrR family transcriptional regulator